MMCGISKHRAGMVRIPPADTFSSDRLGFDDLARMSHAYQRR